MYCHKLIGYNIIIPLLCFLSKSPVCGPDPLQSKVEGLPAILPDSPPAKIQSIDIVAINVEVPFLIVHVVSFDLVIEHFHRVQ